MTMGSEDFKNAILAKAQTGVGRLSINTKSTLGGERYDHVIITFINVPEEQGRGGGGAVAMNNRLLMFVSGFGKGFNEPPPTGKVKFEVGAAELLSREQRPRRKTATPEKMVDYVVKIVNEAAKLEPRLNPGSSAWDRHVEEMKHEMGYEDPVETDLRKTRYRGHVIETWYNQASASPYAWKGWVKGIGDTPSATSEAEAIDNAKKKIDSVLGASTKAL